MNEIDTDANTKAVDQPAQLRDGQVFRRRGARGRALRPRRWRATSGAAITDLDLARRAQHRPGGDLRHRHDRRDGAGGAAASSPGAHDGRRLRAGQRHADPALHPAELPGHGLPRDQAGADRHRRHVRTARAATRRSQDRPGAQPLAGRGGRRALRGRALRLRPGARRSCKGVSFEVPAGQDGRDRRPVGRRQVDDRAPAVPLLRADARPHPDRRPGHRATSRRRACARRSAWCRRTRCCSTTPSATTSATAGRDATDAEVERGGPPRRRSTTSSSRLPDGYETHGRRARPEAVGRREAARRDRPHHLKDPPILVLDEATSALDSRTEQAIQDALDRVAAEPHHAGDRPPPVDRGRRRRDHRARPGAHRRARHARERCWPTAASMPRCGTASARPRRRARRSSGPRRTRSRSGALSRG